MSVDRVASLEARVERLTIALAALQQQLQGLGQNQWQMAGRMTPSGGSGLVRAVLTASLAGGGTPASPSSAAGTILVPDGSGGWTATGGIATTIYSDYNQAISVSGSRFCWVQLDEADGRYYLVVADC